MHKLRLPRLHGERVQPGEKAEAGGEMLKHGVLVKLALFVIASISNDLLYRKLVD